MNKAEMILPVQEYMTPRNCEEKYSRILLQGKWLRDLGFTVGKNVSVQVSNTDEKIELYISLVD